MQGLHRDQIDQIRASIARFSAEVFPLLGIVGLPERRAFVEQLVSSMRRVDYIKGF